MYNIRVHIPRITYDKRIVVVRIYPEVSEEAVDHEIDVFLLVRGATRERLLRLEEQQLEIIDDGLHEREDDVVRVENVDVGGRLAELDAGHGGSVRHSFGGVSRRKRLLDRVDELLLLHVFCRARRARVSVVDLLQDL